MAGGAMNAAAPIGNQVGTNGSMARFSIINNFLYTVGYSNLTAFDISQPYAPAFASTVQVDWHVETIYPLKDRLFVGTNNGMYMYDVQNSPSTPALIDCLRISVPVSVIADDDYAYITLNDSVPAWVQIMNFRLLYHDVGNSFLVKKYQQHPVGLSKDAIFYLYVTGRRPRDL
jgi:hypothetical protein